jgi:hypothetical protein
MDSTINQKHSAVMVTMAVATALGMTALFLTIEQYTLASAVLVVSAISVSYFWASLYIPSAPRQSVTVSPAADSGIPESVQKMLQEVFLSLEKSAELIQQSRASGINIGLTERARSLLIQKYGERANRTLGKFLVIPEDQLVAANRLVPAHVQAQTAINETLHNHAQGKTTTVGAATFIDAFSRSRVGEEEQAEQNELDTLAFVLATFNPANLKQLVAVIDQECKRSAYFKRMIGGIQSRLAELAEQE